MVFPMSCFPVVCAFLLLPVFYCNGIHPANKTGIKGVFAVNSGVNFLPPPD